MIILFVVFSALATAAVADEAVERKRRVTAQHKAIQQQTKNWQKTQCSITESRKYMSKWIA